MSIGLRRLAALAAGGLIAACASPPPAEPPGQRWAGRLSVQVDSDPPQRQSGGFELSGDARRGRLLLLTPLGTAAAEARWDSSGATLVDGNGQRRFGSLDALAAEALGEPLPLAALFDWLDGRPWTAAAWSARDDGIAGFVQMGWQVDLSRHAADAMLVARRAAPPPVTVRVRLER